MDLNGWRDSELVWVEAEPRAGALSTTGWKGSGTGGERGIRTPGRGVSPYNGLANRRLQPLGHLSGVSLQGLYPKRKPGFFVEVVGPVKSTRLSAKKAATQPVLGPVGKIFLSAVSVDFGGGLVLFEAIHSFQHFGARVGRVMPPFDFHPLALKILVNGEKMRHFLEHVGINLRIIPHIGVARIILADGQTFSSGTP